jgi:hypothetical protein
MLGFFFLPALRRPRGADLPVGGNSRIGVSNPGIGRRRGADLPVGGNSQLASHSASPRPRLAIAMLRHSAIILPTGRNCGRVLQYKSWIQGPSGPGMHLWRMEVSLFFSNPGLSEPRGVGPRVWWHKTNTACIYARGR